MEIKLSGKTNPNVQPAANLLFDLVKGLVKYPEDIEIQEKIFPSTKTTFKKVMFRIICNKYDAKWIIGDNGGVEGEKSGACMRGIRALFRNIGAYEETIFDIDLADEIKKFRPVKKINNQPTDK